ncbi:Blue copper protein [Dichanthelium oligosanthes]|uniref:Blue copper protein n=1 Tax=Dichanthelium oligosanthes TaxID=888268 RepID=A0A1E5UZ12_9POAL|nr:Blue copper protein [Dichanthelium oligosanthes]
MASGGASLALAALLLVSCASAAAATKYTVGDTSGWTTSGDYATWASGKKFNVGDSLEFKYTGGAHTVDEVSAADYAACSSSNAISTDSAGSTTVTLKTAGKHYFICGVAGHCSSGMKLVVDVATAKAATPAPAPAPALTPAPDAADTTPDTTPATNPKSPSSSGGKTPVTVLSPPGKKSTSGATGLSAAAWAGLGLAGLVAVHLGAF